MALLIAPTVIRDTCRRFTTADLDTLQDDVDVARRIVRA